MLKTIEEIFRANLVKLRGRRTQAAIAELAGIPLRSYQHVESTGAIPQGPNRTAIALALGVTEAALFVDGEEYGPKRKITPAEALEVLSDLVAKTALKPHVPSALPPAEAAVLERVADALKAHPSFIQTLLATLAGVEAALNRTKVRKSRA